MPDAPASHRPILVAEPQLKGATHSFFNSGLLLAAGLACAESPLVFLGAREHLRWVRAALETSGPSLEPSGWETLPVAGALRRVGRARRVLAEIVCYGWLVWRARRCQARLLLVCSLSRLGIFLVRVLAPRLCPATPVLATIHDVESLLAPAAGRLAASSAWLHRLLRRPSLTNVRWLAPSELAYREILNRDPALGRQFLPLDLPYRWRRTAPVAVAGEGAALRFGLIGQGLPERLQVFSRLADAVKRRYPRVELVLAGYLGGSPRALAQGLDELDLTPAEPLPAEQLAARIDSLTYVVWVDSFESQRLRLSASFLDALSHVKPIIALASPFSEHMFERLGDVGHLCQDEPALLATVSALIEDFPAARYRCQCLTILERRAAFSPEQVAGQLRRAVDELSERSAAPSAAVVA